MIVGIDLGTTNSLIGAMEAGFPILFADQEGQRLTPSVVGYSGTNTPVAGRGGASSEGTVFHSIKRLMGARIGEVESLYPVWGNKGEALRICVNDTNKSPEEISAEILKKLKGDAERALGMTVDRAVITVPAYFNEAQRAATKRSGELAGFTVERLLAEPTAAALAYGLDRSEKSKIAVYDLGGGTFDVSILELSEGVFHVLSTNGDTRLGGDDLDAAIAAALNVSTTEAEKIKRKFSDSDEPVALEEFEAICRPIIERTRWYCLRSLHDAGLQPEDLDEVILVGGSTRMPLVRKIVKDIFRREPNTSQHPDEAVAIGAVIQAGILDGGVNNVTLLDVTPLSLGVETFGGLMNVIVPRNTTIPCKAGEMFTNAVANQSAMRITVLQGEREMAADNWKLGEFSITFPPAARGQSRVGVQFEIDASGLLNVLARDVASGRDTIVKIQSAVEVSDEAVEKMLGDSLEFAFVDMDERIFAEAKIKAEEMLPAVDEALRDFSGALPESELKGIRELCEEVHAAIESHSATRLKKATTALDDATQSLAAHMIEAAMKGDSR